MAGPSPIVTFDGSIIAGIVTGVTAHDWTADSRGQFHTADLSAEWKANYATMLAGKGDTLNAMQRMEGNSEAVLQNTAASKLTAAQQQAFREDGQREYDAIWAAMLTNQASFGIDPTRQFDAYSYLKMEETLQQNEVLKELGYQGHGVNNPAEARYNGFTTEFQNNTDNVTFYVGGGPGNGEKAIANFYDDDVLTHAPFQTVIHNGVLTQLNQNGALEDALTEVLVAANATAFNRVLVASDFSTSATAVGAVVMVPNIKAPAADPVAPAGSIVTFDGSVIAGTIAGITAHSWTADTKGLFHTVDLSAEWKANYATMLAGKGDTLNALQRMEGNAEAVLENTAANKLTAAMQQQFREDGQREYDAIWAAMQINKTAFGIDPAVMFSQYSYVKMEETLQANEQLKELGYQGHGVNTPPAPRYSGFTGDFQNKTDGKTFYVGGGPGSGENAIANFYDDDVLTHAPFAAVLVNGVLRQLNQNGNQENQLGSDALVAANNAAFTRVYVASDFSLDAKAIGEVRLVPNVQAAASPPGVTPAATTTPPAAMVGFVDSTTGVSATVAMDAAGAGGPSYLTSQYIYAGSDNMAFSTQAPGVFIHSGSGNDAIQVASGQNVLDGGLGSNFLTGGTGTDTFFTDSRGAGAVWNTMINFHTGDAATLWGFTAGVSSYSWDAAMAGAAGAQGATLRANIVGGHGRTGTGVDASITFAGLSVAQAKNLQIVTGTQPGGSYLYVYNPGV